MQYKTDLTGQTFNGWQVLEYAGKSASNKTMWTCACLGCGVTKDIDGYHLTKERSKSCRRCSAQALSHIHRTHGETGSVVYIRWQAMKTRCTNPKAKSWKDHGGRGIRVCEEWMNDFVAFRDHIGPMPTPLHTVDRINNDGNYEPGNVRWATQSEQMNNTRRSAKYRQG
jgi:hypothetical protein